MAVHYDHVRRASEVELREGINTVSQSPVVNGLLGAVGGLLAVLNEQRQVLAVNRKMLQAFGIENQEELFGMRPGEVLNCIHAHCTPGGCGTGDICKSCGAMIAMLSSLAGNEPVEKVCVAEVESGGQYCNLVLKVRSCPITIKGKAYLMLFLQDITKQHQMAALESVFFHDVNNQIFCILCNSEMLEAGTDGEYREMASSTRKIAVRMAQEVAMQRSLSKLSLGDYKPVFRDVTVKHVLDELRETYDNHKMAASKSLVFKPVNDGLTLKTDPSVIQRVLGNMLLNAIEATGNHGVVKVWAEMQEGSIVFSIWNDAVIPRENALRVFQQNFSTKGKIGRGLGTYSMKFFGEKFLGGKVWFTSAEAEGTVFNFSLPVGHP